MLAPCLPALAHARCGSDERPWVGVAFSGGDWPRDFQRAVLEDFRAGLQSDSIDVCREGDGPPKPAVATVRISNGASANVDVSVDVKDTVTEKRVGRDVDLSRVPADGRPFALALAADELLRASWAELALRPSETDPARRSAPAEVEAAMERVLPRARSAGATRVFVRGAAEHSRGGQTQLGADAGFQAFVSRRFRLALFAGPREGLSATAPHGTIDSSAFGLGGQLEFLPLLLPYVELAVLAGARANLVRFRGITEPGAQQQEFRSLSAHLRLGAGAALRLFGPLWSELGGSFGLPLRGVEARDDDRTVSGVTGLELGASAGLGIEFP